MSHPPRHTNPPDWELLARHRAGECDLDEAARVTAWLSAHPDDAVLLDALDGTIASHLLRPRADDPDVAAALRAVRTRLDHTAPSRVLPLERNRAVEGAPSRWLAGGLAAAAAIGAIVVGLGRTPAADGGIRLAGPGRVITTAVGVRDSVRLLDGTRVVLAPASRLAVSEDYGTASRLITVEGAAWLRVQHDAAKPFSVKTGAATVRDIGTSFTVRTAVVDGVGSVDVAVTEGEVELVAVASGVAPLRLVAGQAGTARADGGFQARVAASANGELAWTNGRLVYLNSPLDQVRDDLRRWYGVDLQVSDSSLRSRRITATFTGEPIERVLETLAITIGATVERRDSVAVLRSRRIR